MTLTMAWIRSEGAYEELVVASDSRLRAGYAWDAAPKILILPRGDAVLAFAGSTDFAYPMMMQAWNAIASYEPSASRRDPLPKVKGHLVRVLNLMLNDFSDLPKFADKADPDAIFLLAGYSWSEARFRIWTLHFDEILRRFTFRPSKPWRGQSSTTKVLAWAGDEIDLAKERLTDLLRERRKLSTGGFDYEPLEILESMISDPSCPSIGGPVQVVKVYQSLNSVPFVVLDATTGNRSILGRRLLAYEYPDRYPTLVRGSSHAQLSRVTP